MAETATVKYGATVLLNADTDYRQYSHTDRLVYDERTLLDVREDTVEKALDAAFRIGNRLGTDHRGTAWSSDVRSVSVGDVIYVSRLVFNDDGEVILSAEEGFYAVDRLRFTRVADRADAVYSTEEMSALGVAS